MKVRITMIFETELNPEHYPEDNQSVEEMVAINIDADMSMFLSECNLIEHKAEEIK